MLVAFEMTFTMLLEMAKDIGLDLPNDEPALQDIYAKRDLKLAMYGNYICLIVNIFWILFGSFQAKREGAPGNQKNNI